MGLKLWDEFSPDVQRRMAELFERARVPQVELLELLESEVRRLRPDDRQAQQLIAVLQTTRQTYAGGIEAMLSPLGEILLEQVAEATAQYTPATFPDHIDG